jgi:hypothetical protein
MDHAAIHDDTRSASLQLALARINHWVLGQEKKGSLHHTRNCTSHNAMLTYNVTGSPPLKKRTIPTLVCLHASSTRTEQVHMDQRILKWYRCSNMPSSSRTRVRCSRTLGEVRTRKQIFLILVTMESQHRSLSSLEEGNKSYMLWPAWRTWGSIGFWVDRPLLMPETGNQSINRNVDQDTSRGLT